jgi:hypothetical protein
LELAEVTTTGRYSHKGTVLMVANSAPKNQIPSPLANLKMSLTSGFVPWISLPIEASIPKKAEI